ncbi:MAG TPA: ribose-phosphate pyrophosphokinase [Kiritimatiellia bacterium]|nr:ribose-phosphate pyrophosphokinase [Kiritimatiellia bacterium]HPO37071.1 ribose-phosphate pyrophosphokinase [Kiritimatiellia bacterium]HQL51289.1 ribose-phosphate pyrophosphokinase [Kiritimatiellia bacterium]HQQ92556.1 ribose-phosphate pyrophosphokinase [Kiritimatiellia bacterium]
MIVFSGTANLPLAERMMAYLGGRLGDINIRRFPDGETHVKIVDNVRGKDVYMVQPICTQPNEMLMELLIMMDAARRGSAARITAVLPYYGYARQDRKDQPRVPITAKLVANLLVAAGANRVLTMDLHAQQIQGFFDIPVDHLHAAPVMVKYLREMKLKKPLVVSPDTGGAKAAYAYSQMLGTGLAIVAKQRMGDAEVDAFSVVGDVEGCDVIMVDDMTTTCGTLCAAAKILKEKGAASIRAAVTHIPLTEKGVERLKTDAGLTELVVTDTVPLRADLSTAKLPMKLTVLSVAELLGEAIRRIHQDQSVSSLFRY